MYAQAAPLFQAEGVELLALSTGPAIGGYANEFRAKGFSVYHKPFSFDFQCFLSFLIWYCRFLHNHQVDVIHIHRNASCWWLALCGWLCGIKQVRTVHNVFKNRWFTKFKAVLERLSSKKIFGLTYHSIGNSVFLNEKVYYKNSTTKVNNWFDGEKFFPAVSGEEKRVLRDYLGIPQTDFVVISVGGCSYIKNHHDLITAIGYMENQGVYYLHLGCGFAEDEEKALVQSLGLEAKVRFVGLTKDVREYLVASDVYVMPSRHEGLSIAAVEAMACGLPSVLYNVPGLRDMIHNDDNGFLVETNSQALLEAILALHEDEKLRLEMGERAAAFAVDNFGVVQGVRGVMRFYE